jgi:hypothetical protein
MKINPEMKAILINAAIPPVKTVHLGYTVERIGQELRVFAIKDCFYPHPDAPDIALIPTIEQHRVGTFLSSDPEAAPWFLLWNALQNIGKGPSNEAK